MAAVKRNLAVQILIALCALSGVGLIASAIFGESAADKKSNAEREKITKDLSFSAKVDPQQQAKKLEDSVQQARVELLRKQTEGQTSQDRAKAEALALEKLKATSPPPLGYPQVSLGVPPLGALPSPSIGGSTSSDIEQARIAKQIEQEKMLEAVRSSKIVAWEDGNSPSMLSGANKAAAIAGLPSVEELTRMASASGAAGNAAGSADASRDAMREAILRASQAQPTQSPTLEQRNASFLKDASDPKLRTEKNKATLASLPSAPLSKHLIQQGWRIPAVLLTDINSDLPGDLQAMVTEHVYDSIAGRTRLIPQGTRLVGLYNSEVVSGQERLLFAFTRMIYPNGVSVDLGSMQGTDRFGAAGAEGNVNTRFWSVFGSSLLVGAVSTVASRGSNTSNVSINVGGALTQTASSVLAETVKKMLERNINIKPTINLRRGEKFAVSVAHDLVLAPESTSNGF